MLQLKAGYIDARPLTASSAKPLATHGRTIHLGQTPHCSKVFRIRSQAASKLQDPQNCRRFWILPLNGECRIGEHTMIKVSVMYPNTPGGRFDHDYYRDKH